MRRFKSRKKSNLLLEARAFAAAIIGVSKGDLLTANRVSTNCSSRL